MKAITGLTLLFALSPPALSAEPLSLQEVLAAADERIPKLAAAQAKLEEQEGKVLAARGAFDPKLGFKGFEQLEGYYERQQLDAYIAGESPWGIGYEAGWRSGIGDFPDYYGAYETLDGGELRARISAPLLEELGISAERAKLLAAEAGLTGQGAAAALDRLEIAQKAALSYWKWAAAGEKLALARYQLQLAEDRALWIRRQVEEGSLPPIELADNERSLLERRVELLAAEQALAEAAIQLSLWYRGEDMAPIIPQPEQLPPPPPLPPPPELSPSAEAEAIASRPELQWIEALTEEALVYRRLAASRLLPDLELAAQISQDFGEGSPTKEPAEIDLSLGASWELPARKARGELAQSEAALRRLEAERQATEDSLRAAAQTAAISLQMAWERWQLAEQSFAYADQVAELERRSFAAGSSDLFRVNKREETRAKAEKELIEARLAYRSAQVHYAAARGLWPS